MSVTRVCVAWAVVLVCAAATAVRKRKIRLLQPLLLTACVTGASLLTPAGTVIATAGGFRLTLGALLDGLQRSAVLTGMVFLSQFVTSFRLRLPGKAGLFLADVFGILDALTAERMSFRHGHVIEAVDGLLLRAWRKTADTATNSPNSINFAKQNADCMI